MFFRAKVSPLASAELERGIRSVSPRKDRSDPRGCEWDHGGGGDGDGGGQPLLPEGGFGNVLILIWQILKQGRRPR